MIKAYQDGRKTQTRRVILGDRRLSPGENRPAAMPPSGRMVYHDGTAFDARELEAWEATPGQLLPYPYAGRLGQPGDTLIMREALRRAGGDHIEYAADGKRIVGVDWHWKVAHLPAMYMPRWAARYTPKILAVRVERLQDITDSDAQAEGVTFSRREVTWYEGKWRDGFMELWDSIHSATGHGWETNPWVVVREFEQCQIK